MMQRRPAPLLQPIRTFRNVIREISNARRLSRDRYSWLRWSSDIVAIRLLRIVRWPGHDRHRTITLQSGQRLTYRLNRGDLLTLREVWIDEVYRLPGTATFPPPSLVDLGANIGLTSVWFAHTYDAERMVAVEPLRENAELLRHNLAQNNIDATVLEGAVGSTPGTGFFAPALEPNSGYLASDGVPVDIVSMDAVLSALGTAAGGVVLKIDIEGAEQVLFDGELEWLSSVQTILIEFHGAVVDVPQVVETIVAAGFELSTPLSDVEGAVTGFVRRSSTAGA